MLPDLGLICTKGEIMTLANAKEILRTSQMPMNSEAIKRYKEALEIVKKSILAVPGV